MVAPDMNRSAVGRGITVASALSVEEVNFPDHSSGYATDGTPVDCVRLASLGLLGQPPEVVVSGINLGPNLGDDITYSGTVAAAFEGSLLGLPGIAVSLGAGQPRYFEPGASFAAGLVSLVARHQLPPRTVLNVNLPNIPPEQVDGAQWTVLGKRVYTDELKTAERSATGRQRYFIYGESPTYHAMDGSDFNAVYDNKISVTPIRFAVTDHEYLEGLTAVDLSRFLPGGNLP